MIAKDPDEVTVVISGSGVITYTGEGRCQRLGPQVPPKLEALSPGYEVEVGRLGRQRRHPFRERFERMSQLDAFSQFAFIAVGHALDDAEIPAPDPRFEGAGVILGSAFGCQEANAQFDQYVLDPELGVDGVRPAVFKNTVDNVPAGWVALGYKLLGVNATFVSGPGAGAEALISAVWAIEDGRAPQVVAGGVERLIPLQLAALARRGRDDPSLGVSPFPAEGAAVLVLEEAAAAAARGHRRRATLRASTRLADDDPEALAEWLASAGCPPGERSLVSLVGPSPAARDRARAVLEGAGLEGPFLVESDITGDMLAAQAPLALCLLVDRLAGAEGSAPALLWAAGEPGEAFAFLVAPA